MLACGQPHLQCFRLQFPSLSQIHIVGGLLWSRPYQQKVCWVPLNCCYIEQNEFPHSFHSSPIYLSDNVSLMYCSRCFNFPGLKGNRPHFTFVSLPSFMLTQTVRVPLGWSRAAHPSSGQASLWPFPTSPWSLPWRTYSRRWTKPWSASSMSPRGLDSGAVSCSPRWVWDEGFISYGSCCFYGWDWAEKYPFTL